MVATARDSHKGDRPAICIRALARPDAATVPIIAMTANAYREDIDRAAEAGMDGHLAKPVDIDAVLAVLNEKLGGAGQSPSPGAHS